MCGFAHRGKADAIALALGSGTLEAPAPAEENPLTKREMEIARLLAKGMSNREVAASLVISSRTVDGHVERIFGKLGFDSRSQVASWVSSRENAGVPNAHTPLAPTRGVTHAQ